MCIIFNQITVDVYVQPFCIHMHPSAQEDADDDDVDEADWFGKFYVIDDAVYLVDADISVEFALSCVAPIIVNLS